MYEKIKECMNSTSRTTASRFSSIRNVGSPKVERRGGANCGTLLDPLSLAQRNNVRRNQSRGSRVMFQKINNTQTPRFVQPSSASILLFFYIFLVQLPIGRMQGQ